MRAFGYWLGQQGISVINHVRWGTQESWYYCWDSIPKNSIVSIGTIGGSPKKLVDLRQFNEGLIYKYTGTKGHIVAVASSLPQTGAGLLAQGWEDISHPMQAAQGSYTYKEPSTGLRIRYDKSTPGASGFSGKDHYHILNPDAHNNSDMYLDKNGNPCRRGSKESHILPQGGV